MKFLVMTIDYYKMGKSRTIIDDYRREKPIVCLEEHNLQVWNSKCHYILNGRQFDNPKFINFCKDLKIQNHYSSPGHPKANGQTKVTNQNLLKIIKTRLDGTNGAWLEELPNVPCAYRTTTRNLTWETPYRLTFDSEVVIPMEIGLASLRLTNYNEYQNEEELKTNLDLIDEVRNEAQQRMEKYQGAITRYYNRRVKIRRFSLGDLVLKKVSQATKDHSQGKLGPDWEGPYKVIHSL